MLEFKISDGTCEDLVTHSCILDRETKGLGEFYAKFLKSANEAADFLLTKDKSSGDHRNDAAQKLFEDDVTCKTNEQ